mmetsp:Transcript_78520/g.123870  ORF Transcript_78520/g.123870 Transcript_78520/m.123870 type:complete len:258 (-) Transcript_78520:148-921(-)
MSSLEISPGAQDLEAGLDPEVLDEGVPQEHPEDAVVEVQQEPAEQPEIQRPVGGDTSASAPQNSPRGGTTTCSVSYWKVLMSKCLILLSIGLMMMMSLVNKEIAVFVLPLGILMVLLLLVMAIAMMRNWILVRRHGPLLTRERLEERIWARDGQDQEKCQHFCRFSIHLRSDKELQISQLGPATTPSSAWAWKAEKSCGCCICLEEPDLGATLPCGHFYCEECIARWSVSGKKQSTACPVCRQPFEAKSDVKLSTEP